MFWVALLPLLLSSADTAYFLDDRLSAPPQHSILDRPFFYPQVPDLFGYSGFLEPYYQPQPTFYHQVSTAAGTFTFVLMCSLRFFLLSKFKTYDSDEIRGKNMRRICLNVFSFVYSFEHEYCFRLIFMKTARVLVLVYSLLTRD